MKIENMEVFKKSHTLVLEIYNSTSKFPKEEIYGLTSQMRRAAYSIPMNLAEGYARNYNQEYIHFISIAIGSSAELKYQIRLSKDLKYIDENNANDLKNKCEKILKMLISMKNKLKNKGRKK